MQPKIFSSPLVGEVCKNGWFGFVDVGEGFARLRADKALKQQSGGVPEKSHARYRAHPSSGLRPPSPTRGEGSIRSAPEFSAPQRVVLLESQRPYMMAPP